MTGIDLSPVNCLICQEGLPEEIKIYCTDAREYLSADSHKFGLILMSHVLEHVSKEECVNFLVRCREALQARGKLVITVPNAACLEGLYIRYGDFTHQQGFTKLSLAQILEIFGFSHIELLI